MRRRTTLALVAGGAAAAAAGGAIVGGRLRTNRPEHDASNPEGRTMEAENWYLEHKPKIMRQVRFALRHYRRQFVAAYGKEEGEAIASESMQRFEALLPDLPYIGGDENTNTRSLYMTAAWLAMYRSLQARGASVEEAARLIYLGTTSFFNSFPTRWLMRLQGRRLFSRTFQDQRRHAAAISQQRRYPEDWVFEVVEGNGQGLRVRGGLHGVRDRQVPRPRRCAGARPVPVLDRLSPVRRDAPEARPDRDAGPGRAEVRLPDEPGAAGAGRAGVPARLTGSPPPEVTTFGATEAATGRFAPCAAAPSLPSSPALPRPPSRAALSPALGSRGADRRHCRRTRIRSSRCTRPVGGMASWPTGRWAG